jgi:hypothetical protein
MINIDRSPGTVCVTYSPDTLPAYIRVGLPKPVLTQAVKFNVELRHCSGELK